jgi:phosphate transport system substrate-binding protein
MNKGFLFILLSTYLLISSCGNNNQSGKASIPNDQANEEVSGIIKISGSSTMYQMVNKLAEEYSKVNPKIKIQVNSGNTGEGIKNLGLGNIDIAMVSRNQTIDEKSKGYFFVPIAKDAVLPIISFDNYFLQEIVIHGITKQNLIDVFITGKIKTWGQLLKINNPSPIKLYTRADTSGTAETWAYFLGKSHKDLCGTLVNDERKMLENVAKDPQAIGYCSLSGAYDLKTGFRSNGIYILPIDLNSNKQLDDKEAFYDKHSQIVKAINSGSMPTPPSRDLYLVCKSKPKEKHILAFLNWVLTIGQNYIEPSGNVFLQKENAKLVQETLK